MAKSSKRSGGQYWTNERHLHFLNFMEASFVESMFEITNIPPLDRYLPDTFDSTHDLSKHRRPITNFASDNVEPSGRRPDKKSRMLSCQKSSQDQVVPQFQNKRDDEDRDRLDDASLGTAH